MRMAALLSGVAWIAGGLILLRSWKRMLTGVTVTWSRIGVPVDSETVNRIIVRAIVVVIAVGAMLAG